MRCGGWKQSPHTLFLKTYLGNSSNTVLIYSLTNINED